MKDIETNGFFSEHKHRPDTFDIPKRSELALKHILELSDQRFNYVTYIGAALCEDPPHFVHHRLGWTEALPYSVHGAVVGRNITGSQMGKDIQFGQRKLMLSHFNEMDGLVHAPQSPWNKAYPLDIWEQARTLYAIIYWFLDSEEEQLLRYADEIVDGLFAISRQEGKKRIFPNELIKTSSMGCYAVGAIIDPLVKYYELTGNPKAFQIARGTTCYMLDPQNGFFDTECRFNGFFRTVVSFVTGLSRLASLTGDPMLLQTAVKYHEYMISKCTAYGSTPCNEPVCSDLELNMSAIALTKAGYTEYWDQIDRFIRNQIAEAQFLDTAEWVAEKASKKRVNRYNIYDFYDDDLKILPYDDYRDIVKRSIGGFFWCTADEHMYFPASLMVCCTSHALRSFEIVWLNALKEDFEGITSDLHYNFENELGEVISYEPYQGRVSIILKKDSNLKIRIPEYALGEKITGTCDDKEIDIRTSGRYACFNSAKKGCTYSLNYSLNKRMTEETQFVYEYPDYEHAVGSRTFEAHWRGNTVVRLLPESNEEKRMYKRAHMDTDIVPFTNKTYYITHKKMYE